MKKIKMKGDNIILNYLTFKLYVVKQSNGYNVREVKE